MDERQPVISRPTPARAGWLQHRFDAGTVTIKQNISETFRISKGWRGPRIAFFFLTVPPNNLIYESHCDLTIANLDVRETQSMKNATKKAAKKAPAKKAPAKKKK
jgi:hypothetical protein